MEIRKSELYSEKRDVQRSNDGLSQHPSPYEVNMLYTNKTQCNGVGQFAKLFPPNHIKEPSNKRIVDYCQRKNGISVLNTAEKTLISSKLTHPLACVNGKTIAGVRNEDREVHCSENVRDKIKAGDRGIHDYDQRLRDQRNRSKEVRRKHEISSSRRNKSHNVCGVKSIASIDVQLNQEGNTLCTQETRITSLRKLLHTPLHVSGSKVTPNLCQMPDPVLQRTTNADRAANIPGTTDEQSLESPYGLVKNNSPELKAVNALRSSSKHRTRRKRSSTSMEDSGSLTDHDEVKEKIAELARTPRIKSLDEILASLRIKFDSKVSDNTIVSGTLSNDRNILAERPASAYDCDSIAGSSKTPSSQCELSDFRGETPKQIGSVTDSTDSMKRVKILLSGEVSRKPKSTCSSQQTLNNSLHSCTELGVQSQANYQQQTTTSKWVNGNEIRRCDWKVLKNQQRDLACKIQANNTKELKAILQARTSYRKEIHGSTSTDSLAIPCKKPRHDTDISKRIFPSDLTWNFQADSESVIEDRSPENGENNSSFSELESNNVSKSPSDPESPENSDGDQSSVQNSVEEEVSEILSQLPPLTETDLSWSDSEESSRIVASQEDIEQLASTMYDNHIEGINGNYNRGTLSDTFREWHQTVVRPSYAGPLPLLPYVIID